MQLGSHTTSLAFGSPSSRTALAGLIRPGVGDVGRRRHLVSEAAVFGADGPAARRRRAARRPQPESRPSRSRARPLPRPRTTTPTRSCPSACLLPPPPFPPPLNSSRKPLQRIPIFSSQSEHLPLKQLF